MIEFFAGVAVLCSVAKQHGMAQSYGVDKTRSKSVRSSVVTIDLTQQASRDLAELWLNSTLICWAHFAPVCGTASRAREIDTGERNQPRPLRSNDAPDGLPDLSPTERRRVDLANSLYSWACMAFILCVQRGVLATMENPNGSLFWRTSYYKKLLQQFTPFSGIFQACMFGSSRPKWTRLVASFKEIQKLSVACDNQHEHAAWGKTFHPETGQEVWATSLESRYPRKLCVAIVHVVLQVLHSNGLQLLPESLSAISDSPLHRSQLSSVAISKQPISGKIPPLVPDFSRVQVLSLPIDVEVPVAVLSKLSKVWNPDADVSIPPGSRLLRCTRKTTGVEKGVQQMDEQDHNIQELAFGIPWTVHEHIQAAVEAKHPMDILEFLPSSLIEAVDKHHEWGVAAISDFRIAWCRKWLARSKELEVHERLQAANRADHVYQTTTGKRVLLIKEMLAQINYQDIKAVDLLVEGSSLAGEIPKIPVWCDKFKPAMSTIQQLEQRAPGMNQYIVASMASSGDDTLDEAVWDETQSELAKGWIDGPWRYDHLPGGSVISRRFGLRQSTKVRVIDDFSCSGVNDTCQTHSKPELHAIDCFCGLVKAWFKRSLTADTSGLLLAKTYDLKSAYRQVPVATSHLKYGYVCVYNPISKTPEVYRMLTLPFGASHSVYSFLRLARTLFELATKSLLLLTTNFYDDFVLASPDCLKTSSANSMEMLFLLTGWSYARDGKKATAFSRHCEALGVHFDLDSSGDRVLRVNNTAKRVAEICEQIQLVFHARKMDKKLALQLRGRLGFADTYLHGRFGALLMKHLIDHAYSSTTQVSDELLHVLTALFVRLQDNKAKEIKVSTTDQKFLIYTDASYEQGAGGIGGVLVDSNGAVVNWFSHQLSEDVCKLFGSGEKETIIYELELVAAIFALTIWSEHIKDHCTVLFVDNEAVRFTIIKASTRGGVAMKLVKYYISLESDLALSMWCARVASESNIADAPSRNVSHELLSEDLRNHSSFQSFLSAVGVSLDP